MLTKAIQQGVREEPEAPYSADPFFSCIFRYCVNAPLVSVLQGHFNSCVSSARVCDLTNQFFKINGFLKILVYIHRILFISVVCGGVCEGNKVWNLK